MVVRKIIASRDSTILELLSDNNIKYNQIQKCLRKKDIKVNSKRISQDCVVSKNDIIEVYLSKTEVEVPEMVYNDSNIVVFIKPRGIETISSTGNNFYSQVKSFLGEKLYAVHRLDRNTSGIVVFAKNINAKNELDYAFKNRTLEKFYLALVYGNVNPIEKTLTAYLKKDNKNSKVFISSTNEVGFEKIITKYKKISGNNETSLLQIELVTGKTHQIRAHLAFIGHFIIGDEKYGNSIINKKYKKKYQCLTATKIIFHFNKNAFLSYLDGKIIEINDNKIDFLSKNK